MRAHVIEGGKVINTIEVESLDFMPGLIDAAQGGKIGDFWNGGGFTTPEITLAVPVEVTRRQALQQLRIEGFTEDQIIAKINELLVPQLQKDLALIEFKESQVFERKRPLVSTLGAMLGKDSAGIDAMFIDAAKLP